MQVTYRFFKPKQEWSCILLDLFSGATTLETTEEKKDKFLSHWRDRVITEENEWYIDHTVTI